MSEVITKEHPLAWKPLKNKVFKDAELADKIHKEGYAILPLLTDDMLVKLKEIYRREHSLKTKNGGMFYSVYSSDNAYRNRVHTEIQQVLAPLLEAHFQDYKNVINSFVVKSSGKESEFYVHQDTTAVDETKYSPLSLWIPLQEINDKNGALTLIEKSHWFFSPYRGVSFAFPFSKIVSTVRNYLKPIYMQAGEVLLFDPRVIHNSMENASGEDRVAIICGIFEQDAEFITCYKDPSSVDTPIELYKHSDSYLLEYQNFFYDCHARPTSGEKITEISAHFPEMTREEFTELCALNSIEEVNVLSTESGLQCNMIAEPDGVNKPELVLTEVPESKTIPQRKSGLFSWLKR